MYLISYPSTHPGGQACDFPVISTYLYFSTYRSYINNINILTYIIVIIISYWSLILSIPIILPEVPRYSTHVWHSKLLETWLEPGWAQVGPRWIPNSLENKKNIIGKTYGFSHPQKPSPDQKKSNPGAWCLMFLSSLSGSMFDDFLCLLHHFAEHWFCLVCSLIWVLVWV